MTIAKDSTLTSGAVRGLLGPLVRMPISATAYSLNNASQGLSSNAQNPDGSANSVALSIAAGPAGSVSSYTQRLQGRAVGIRFQGRSPADAGTPVLDTIIDGIAYGLDHTQLRFDNTASTSGRLDLEDTWLVDDSLPERKHSVTVVLSPDVVGGAARTFSLYGYLTEQARGYVAPPAPPRSTVTSSGTALTSSAASIPFAYGIAATNLQFSNGDTVDRVVTIYASSGVTAADVYGKLTVPAGKTAGLPFPSPRLLAGWKWLVDAAGSGTVYGKTDSY